MKKEDQPEEPQLNITDDLNDDEPVVESIEEKNEEVVQETVPIVSAESEPASTKIDVKDGAKLSFREKLAAAMKTTKGKVIAAILVLAVLFGILFAIPLMRYTIAGIVVKKDISLTVIDADSKKPVSNATVTLGTFSGQTDSKGIVKLSSVPVGDYVLMVNKKYYASTQTDYNVPILSAPHDPQPQIKATGRSVMITVTNKINGKVLSGATIAISESSAVTNDKGQAQIILPVKTEAQKGTVKADGYNSSSFEIEVKAADDQKTVATLTPSGKIFFLSKRTGKIDVMKSDLDGSNAEVIVAGTGQESDTQTVLLSTKDWKYLALQATRDSDKPKLYLIDTASGKMTIMDEGDAEFQLIGWSGHQFVYQVVRNQSLWADKRQALKSYNAETTKLATLDETQGSGSNYYDYVSQSIANPYIVGDQVVYSKTLDIGSSVQSADKKSSIMVVNIDGTNKKSLKDFAVTDIAYFDARLYEPGGVFYRAASRSDNKGSYYEFEDGKLFATSDTNDQKFFNAFYATYLESPSGKKTFWYESRDGKNAIFVGDASANNPREIGTSDYTPYGWYSDDYLLVSKGGSELYVLGQDGTVSDTAKPLKITDYHKPQVNFQGYGSGYGGQ